MESRKEVVTGESFLASKDGLVHPINRGYNIAGFTTNCHEMQEFKVVPRRMVLW